MPLKNEVNSTVNYCGLSEYSPADCPLRKSVICRAADGKPLAAILCNFQEVCPYQAPKTTDIYTVSPA